MSDMEWINPMSSGPPFLLLKDFIWTSLQIIAYSDSSLSDVSTIGINLIA